MLCGFMGCGKSTVGRELAAQTGLSFLDMDDYIVEKAGLPVEEIFPGMASPISACWNRRPARSLPKRVAR